MKKMKNLFFVGVIILLVLPFGFVGADGGGPGSGLENPIESNTIQGLVSAILKLMVRIGVPIVIFFIIYSGFLFVTARGNPEKINIAKTTLLWTIIGAAIVLGAEVISITIEGTIEQLKSGTGL